MRLPIWTLALASFFPAVGSAQGLAIDHAGGGCMVARKSPVLAARIDPAGSVARARVFFRAAGRPQWYFIEMKGQDGVFKGTLPRPRKGTERIEYYIEATDTSAASSRTPDQASTVVSSAAECSRIPVVASVAGEPTVAVGAPPGASVVPAGFEANGVVAAGAAVGAAAGAAVAATAATAAAGGGGIGTTALVIGGVVVAGGAAAAVAASSGGDGGDDASDESGNGGSCGTVSITGRTATTLTIAWSGGNPTDGKYVVDGGRAPAGADCSAFVHEFGLAIVPGQTHVFTGLQPATTYAVHVHPAGARCSICDSGYELTETVGSAVGATLGQ